MDNFVRAVLIGALTAIVAVFQLPAQAVWTGKDATGTTVTIGDSSKIVTAGGVEAAVAFTGIVGFVGLVAPHIARMLSGSDNRRLMPSSALIGATLLVCADLVSRTIVVPTEVPVGVVTALIGAPFFLWLMFKSKRTKLRSRHAIFLTRRAKKR